MLELDEVPNVKSVLYPEKLSVALTTETKEKLQILKKNGKDTAALVRMLIDDFLKTVDFDDAV